MSAFAGGRMLGNGLVNLTGWFVGIWGHAARSLQTGQVQRYILYTGVGVGIAVLLVMGR